MKRLFGSREFASGNSLKNCFVLGNGGSDGDSVWVAKLLLFFRIEMIEATSRPRKKVVIFPGVQCTEPKD